MAQITTTASPKPYFTRQGAAQADTGQTDWLVVPQWANYLWVMLNVTASAGTTPLVDIAFQAVNPVSLTTTHVLKIAEHADMVDNDGTAAQYVFQLGPGVTGIADDSTISATADSYASFNVVLPPIIGIILTLDRTTGNETYTYNLAAYFKP